MGKIAYEKVGLSVRDLQIKLFDDFREDTRSMDRLERFCHLKALMLRIDNVTKNKKDLLMVLGLSVYRQGLLMSELAVLDGQKVSSYFEEVASTLKATNSKSKEQSRVPRRDFHASPVKCNQCQASVIEPLNVVLEEILVALEWCAILAISRDTSRLIAPTGWISLKKAQSRVRAVVRVRALDP